MNWFDGLQAFEKVAECESFIKAARALSTNNSVITKRIFWLEQKLSTSLLLRTTRKVSLTDAGMHLLKRIKPLLSEWDDIHRQLVDYQSQPQGTLDIALPPNIAGTSAFIQALQQFSELYPLVKLQLRTSHKALSLIDKKIDVLLAPEKYLLEPQNTIGTTLFSYSYQCFASPAYLSKHGNPIHPTELCAHNCLTYNTDNRWQFDDLTAAVSGTLQSDSGDCLIGAARMGMGIIHIPQFMAQEEVQRGELQQILSAFQGKQDRFMAFYAKHDYKPRKIAVFIEFLLGYFSINQL